eukprot:3933994-Prymnesium_polylepis.1
MPSVTMEAIEMSRMKSEKRTAWELELGEARKRVRVPPFVTQRTEPLLPDEVQLNAPVREHLKCRRKVPRKPPTHLLDRLCCGRCRLLRLL